MDQGKLIEAIAELREAVRLKPEDDGAHYNLGRAPCTIRAGWMKRLPCSAPPSVLSRITPLPTIT